MIRTLAFALAFAASSFAVAPDSAPVEVGRIEKAKNAFIIRDRHISSAKRGDIVLSTDVVTTDRDGGFILLLKDGSKLFTGGTAELRVATLNLATQQTLVELLRGTVRAEVHTVTKPGGSFAIRTPTAYVTALGTTESVTVETLSSTVGSVIDQRTIDDLPLNGRNFESLIQLAPGVAPGHSSAPTISDFGQPSRTIVVPLDHVSGVSNALDTIPGAVYPLPGNFTIINPGMPPTAPAPVFRTDTWQPTDGWKDAQKEYESQPGSSSSSSMGTFLAPFDYSPCTIGYSLTGQPLWTWDPSHMVPAGSGLPFQVEITGNNISTGDALTMRVTSDSPCTVEIFIPSGTVFHPKGFVGHVVAGVLFGSKTSLKDFQRTTEFGTIIRVQISLPPDWGGGSAAAPVLALMRSYCVDLHKLAPHDKTEYRIANAAEQEKFSPDQPIIAQTIRMLQTGEITLGAHSIDALIQWALWKHIEQLGETQFYEEYTKIVRRNVELQKKKWDKETQQAVEASARDLWPKVDAIERATYKLKARQPVTEPNAGISAGRK